MTPLQVYKYHCSHCTRGMEAPTIRQIVSSKDYPFECKSCGKINYHKEDLLEAFEQLVEQITELKKQVERLEDHIWPNPMEE